MTSEVEAPTLKPETVASIMAGTCAVGTLDCSLAEFLRGLKFFMDEESRGFRCDTHLLDILRRAACVAWELEQSYVRADTLPARPDVEAAAREIPKTDYKTKRRLSDKEQFRLNRDLQTYEFNNCDHEVEGRPNHLVCRLCALEIIAALTDCAPSGAGELITKAQNTSGRTYVIQPVAEGEAMRQSDTIMELQADVTALSYHLNRALSVIEGEVPLDVNQVSEARRALENISALEKVQNQDAGEIKK